MPVEGFFILFELLDKLSQRLLPHYECLLFLRHLLLPGQGINQVSVCTSACTAHSCLHLWRDI